VAALAITTACGSSGSSGSSSSGGKKAVKVALILKTFSNPYFVSMEKNAKADAAKLGVVLTVSAGTTDGDTATQISAIDNAIAAGDAGIVITPNGNAVNSALVKARQAGLYTIALDTAPTPSPAILAVPGAAPARTADGHRVNARGSSRRSGRRPGQTLGWPGTARPRCDCAARPWLARCPPIAASGGQFLSRPELAGHPDLAIRAAADDSPRGIPVVVRWIKDMWRTYLRAALRAAGFARQR